MAAVTIFVSHIFEERELATILKRHVGDDFLGMVDVFVSSDIEDVSAGTNWLQAIDEALRRADMMVLCCSPLSVRRPWINFEAGAAWMRGIPLVPFCHSGLEPKSLPMPLTVLQGVRASDPTGLQSVYKTVAARLKAALPKATFGAIAAEISAFEDRYKIDLPPGVEAAATREAEILGRMKKALDDPKWRWRTVKRLAFEAAVSAPEAADILRGDPDVVFGRDKEERLLARLRWK